MLTRLFFPLCLCSLLFACQPKSTVPITPNVLLILTDDQGYGDIGLHDNDSIRTPQMDRIARDGVRLDNFFVSPVCAPTRASLLTGRYHFRTGTNWVTRNAEAMRGSETTLAEVFQANGYATGAFGKWHNGAHGPEHPLGQGFDEFVGFCAGHWSNYFDPPLEAAGQEIQTQGYINDILTDSALSFMQRNQDQPFFCYLPYNTPHTPYISPEDHYEAYRGEGRSEKVASTYGMVESIDDNLARLISQLENLGLRENTVVIFMTDNGPNYDRYNGGMKGRKGHVNDGGVRVPCFVEWPTHLPQGRVVSELTAHIDWLPTLVDLLGLTPPETKPLDGVSMADLLRGEADTLNPRTFYTFSPGINRFRGSLRNDDYRLVVEKENQYVLTDFQTDRAEAKPLNATFPEVAQSLYAEYLAAFDEMTNGLEQFPPLPIAYETEPTVILSAHEGYRSGAVSYQANPNGWANDWFVNWAEPSDSMYWNVEVAEQSRWEVRLRYGAKPEHLGAKLHLFAGEKQLEARLEQAFTPQFLPNHEQVLRDQEAVEMTWTEMSLGEITLEPGRQSFVLQASEIQNGGVAEVKALILERK